MLIRLMLTSPVVLSFRYEERTKSMILRPAKRYRNSQEFTPPLEFLLSPLCKKGRGKMGTSAFAWAWESVESERGNCHLAVMVPSEGKDVD